MGYDRGDSIPFDFKPNENPFGSKSKGILSPRSFIPFNLKGNRIRFVSVCKKKILFELSLRIQQGRRKYYYKNLFIYFL